MHLRFLIISSFKGLMFLFSLTISACSFSSVWTYSYPNSIVNKNDATVKRSTLYNVKVNQGMVNKDAYVMFDKNQAENVNSNLAKDPDHHWTSFSVDGGAVKIEITRLDGGDLTSAKVFPLKKGYTANVSNNKATIIVPAGVNKLQLYIEINGLKQQPLFVFVDPKETDVPDLNGSNVTVINPSDDINTVKSKLNSGTVYKYFAPGVHVWGTNTGSGYAGYKLPIKEGKKIYLPGGAYVIGSFSGNNAGNWKVYGRGVISGAGLNVLETAEYIPWSAVHHSGNKKGMRVEGIVSMCPPHFGITIRGECDIDNVKMTSWWYSTDGTITGDNSTVNNCFFKVNDDAIKVYGNNCSHDNNTMYHQVNGAPFQFSWTGQEGRNTISTNTYIVQSVYKGSLNGTSNTAVVNCREANKGQTIENHVFDGLYIDNGCHRLLGLDATKGTLKNITVKNVELNQGDKSNPQNGYSYLDNGVFSGIELCNVKVNGNLINALDNISDKPSQGKLFFKGQTGPMSFCTLVCTIDSDNDGTNDCNDLCPNDPHKKDPGNCGCGRVDEPGCGDSVITNVNDLELLNSCGDIVLKWTDVAGEDGYRIRRKIVGETVYLNLGDVAQNITTYKDFTATEGVNYVYMVRPLKSNVAVAVSNITTITPKDCIQEIPPLNNWLNVIDGDILSETFTIQTEAYDDNYGSTHGDGIKQINYQIFDANDLSNQIDFFSKKEYPFHWTFNTSNYPDGNYQLRSGAVSQDDGEVTWIIVDVEINNTVTFTEKEIDQNQITLFPNPSCDIVNIKGIVGVKWELYATTGEILDQGTSNTVNLTSYSSGIYYLSIGNTLKKVTKL